MNIFFIGLTILPCQKIAKQPPIAKLYINIDIETESIGIPTTSPKIAQTNTQPVTPKEKE